MSSAEIIATIKQGKLRGKSDENIKGEEFWSFLGIPYAKPPVGKLRFKDPEPAEGWNNIRDATKEGEGCFSFTVTPPETDTGDRKVMMYGSEDCLFLNVFTRQLKKESKQLKPVMFYVHGGAFTVGSGSSQMYGPRHLMLEDIVLVTINYRVGALGFLSLSESQVANAGLKDAIQALKWVQENIEEFGGDPKNVTVFGESAGGAAIHYLVLSPLSKGLFQKAISQSGCALNSWALGQKDCGKTLSKQLGCKETDDDKILTFLQQQPVAKILDAQLQLGDFFDISRNRYFSPIIEKPSKAAFISENPMKIIKSGGYNHVPLMLGYTSNEGLIIHMVDNIDMKISMVNTVPFTMPLGDSEEKARKAINQFYFGKDAFDPGNVTASYDLATDSFFSRGIQTSAKLHAKTSHKPVYLYKVTLVTELNFAKKSFSMEAEPGAAHGDELGYLFNSQVLNAKLSPGSAAEIGVKRFVKLWANFAKTGNPTPPGKDSLLDVEWKPVDAELNYLEIGQELKAGTDPDKERMAFWDQKILPLSSNKDAY